MNRRRSGMVFFIKTAYFIIISSVTMIVSQSVYGEVESTTLVGLMNRSLELNIVSSDVDDESSIGQIKSDPEILSGLAICERVAANSSFGVKFGTGGCILTGGVKTMYSVLSVQLSLIYNPFYNKGLNISDAGVSTQITEKSQIYLMGVAGFSKITSKENTLTNVSIATDVVDFGGGIGYSYSIANQIQVVAEAQYLVGSIVSNVAQGSTSSILIGAGIGLTL